MKKYYEIERDSDIAKAYTNWKEMQLKINDAFKEFANEVGITTTKYYPVTGSLWIVPDPEDNKKFEKELKTSDYGVFKKTSPTAKAWVAKCIELGLKDVPKPRLMFYFNIFHSCRESIFSLGDKFYATFETEGDFKCHNEAFRELKASEFYATMEAARITVE